MPASSTPAKRARSRTGQVTLKDISERVGVSLITVSRVLNHVSGPVKVRAATSEKIFKVAQELGYQPNVAARALRTNRIGQLGLVLSDQTTDGWCNPYFARGLAGADQACKELGYALSVSTYNLSNIESFVIPPKVGRRMVDGLLLCGYVQRAVVDRFHELDIPVICMGDNLEVAQSVPTVACDIIHLHLQALRHLQALGHRRIGRHLGATPRNHEVFRLVAAQAAKEPALAGMHLTPLAVAAPYNAAAAAPLLEHWQAMPPSQRCTALMSGPDTLLAFQRELRRAGLACPADISLICDADTPICPQADPPLTAMNTDLARMAHAAVHALVRHLEQGEAIQPLAIPPLPPQEPELYLRGSTGHAPA